MFEQKRLIKQNFLYVTISGTFINITTRRFDQTLSSSFQEYLRDKGYIVILDNTIFELHYIQLTQSYLRLLITQKHC